MPPQQGQNMGLFGDSVKKHRGDETVMPGGGDLPPGIENGVAELVEAKIDKFKTGDNKGESFAFFSGVVISVGAGEPNVIGRRANKMIALHPSADGKKSKDDRVAELLNELRLFKVDTSTFENDQDVLAAMAALKTSGTKFAFRTWVGKPDKRFPNPRPQCTFQGAIDFDGSTGAPEGGSVQDSSGEASGDSGEPDAGGTNWLDLGARADGGDTTAAEAIDAAGKQYGIDTANAPSWSEAAAAIAEAEAGGGGEASEAPAADEGEAAEPWTPEVGQVYDYKPKGARKAVSCEVTAVFSKTVNLKEVTGGKPHKAVPWTSNPDTLGGVPV